LADPYLFNLREPGGRNINVVIASPKTPFKHLFDRCEELNNIIVDSITWKKKIFYRPQYAHKSIGSLFPIK